VAQSESAPGAGGEHTTVVTPSEPGDDHIRRLLGEPPDPVSRFGLRQGLGLLGLVAAIVAAAFVMPPLIAPTNPAAPPPGAAPLRSDPSPAVSSPRASATRASEPPTAASQPDTITTMPLALATQQPKDSNKNTRSAPSGPGKATAKFTPITVQAEDASLSRGAARVDCGTCEGGARVRYVGRVDVRATIPSSGTYDLTVVYEVDGSRGLVVSINGNPPIATRKVIGQDWKTPRAVTLSAALPAGSIDIALSGDPGNAPDIDAVTIS
jgi:hypothetical protein